MRIEVASASLNGDATVPDNAQGLVVFVHGSGSSRFSPRNRAVADYLVRAQLGTLLLDLLTEPEERTDASLPSSGSTSRCWRIEPRALSIGLESRRHSDRFRLACLAPAREQRLRSWPRRIAASSCARSSRAVDGRIWRDRRSIEWSRRRC
jgi:hypothetical protein